MSLRDLTKCIFQTGPPNNPTFSMVCCIDDQTFQGEGKSKKEAKLACSQKAIEAIVGIKISENRSMPEKSNPRANCDLDDWMELEGKNPVSILNELYPGIQYRKCTHISFDSPFYQFSWLSKTTFLRTTFTPKPL